MKLKYFFFIFILIELTLRIFIGSIPYGNFDASESLGILKGKSTFYTERFCDTVHQTKRGERTLAKYINSQLHKLYSDKLAYSKFWSFGASTTEGHNCQSKTSWPEEIVKLSPSIKINNFAHGGQTSSESLIKLEHNIKDIEGKNILWAHGFSEIAFYGNNKDYSWNKVENKINRINHSSIKINNVITYMLRIDLTLRKYSYSYRLFRHYSDPFIKKRIKGEIRFITKILGSLAPTRNEHGDIEKRENYIFSGGFLGGPVRRLFSTQSQTLALKLYRQNLIELKRISTQHHITVTCISLPYLKGGFSHFSKKFGENVDHWIQNVNSTTLKSCKELGFNIINAKSYYMSLAFKDNKYTE